MKLIECPRDAMQGFAKIISTEHKIKYLNALLEVGFDTLDCGAFVNPKAVPQMADTAEVLQHLNKSKTKLLTIIANLKGAENALEFSNIDFLGYPFSISETFQLRNTNKSISESYLLIDELVKLKGSKELVVYISMGFGNPYKDNWSQQIVFSAVEQLVKKGVKIISLADTTGLAQITDISPIYQKLIAEFPQIEFGSHFHATRVAWQDKILIAYESGCRRFDLAMLGYGGCPFAEDELVGNTATELFVDYFINQGHDLKINLSAFNKAKSLASEVFN